MQLSKKIQSRCVCLVGAFPPPVHGVSTVNLEVSKHLFNQGVEPLTINLSASSLDRAWYVRLQRITKVLTGLGVYLQMLLSKNMPLYVGLSGGQGQFYEILFVVLARLFQTQIYLHHHGYAYLYKRTLHTYLLTRVAGSDATHVVLCPDMGQKLQEKYRSIQHVFVLSNTAIIKCNQFYYPNIDETLKTIAFLGNIAPEKGVFEFLDVVERLASEGVEIKALIAGPFQDKAIETTVFRRISGLHMTEYVGPKYDQEKVGFYRKINVLLFPTKYIHEAEPLTICEAMSYGVPVIAWERGCIGSIITPGTGLVVAQTDDFVSRAVEQIKRWQVTPQSYQAASNSAAKRFSTMKAEYSKSFDELLSMMIGSSSVE